MNWHRQETLGYETGARTIVRLMAQRSEVAALHSLGGVYEKTESRQAWSLELAYEHNRHVRHSRAWAVQI